MNHRIDCLKSEKSIFGKMFGVTSLVFFLFVFLIKVISVFHYLTLSIIIVSLTIIILLSILIFVRHKRIYSYINIIESRINAISYSRALIVVGVLCFVPKLIVGLIMQIDSTITHIDIFVYQNVASEIANSGNVLTYFDYCNAFEHVFWMGFLLSPVYRLFGDNQIILFIVFNLIFAASSVLCFDVFRMYTTKVKAFIAITIYNLLPSTIILPQFITHEIPFLFLLTVALWLYFRAFALMKRVLTKAVIFLVFASVLSAATLLNASGIIACIALVVHFLFFLNKGIILRVLKSLTLFSVVLCTGFLSHYVVEAYIDQANVSSPKFNKVEWTVYVGSNINSKGGYSTEDSNQYGWNSMDMNTFEEKGYTEQQVIKLRHELVFERYKNHLKNPIQLFNLYITKIGKIWSSFNYSINAVPAALDNEISNKAYKSFFVPSALSLEMFLSLFAIGLALKQFKNTLLNDCGCYQFAVLYLIGSTCLFAITECNNKYSISMQPFFWLVIVLNISLPYFKRRPE